MAAKIYSAPENIQRRQQAIFEQWEGVVAWQANDEKYLQEVRDFLLKRWPNKKMVGEIIRFQVADGYAQYMVMSLRPLELMFLDMGDGYSFQYVERLTAKDVRELVEREQAMQKLFVK